MLAVLATVCTLISSCPETGVSSFLSQLKALIPHPFPCTVNSLHPNGLAQNAQKKVFQHNFCMGKSTFFNLLFCLFLFVLICGQ